MSNRSGNPEAPPTFLVAIHPCLPWLRKSRDGIALAIQTYDISRWIPLSTVFVVNPIVVPNAVPGNGHSFAPQPPNDAEMRIPIKNRGGGRILSSAWETLFLVRVPLEVSSRNGRSQEVVLLRRRSRVSPLGHKDRIFD